MEESFEGIEERYLSVKPHQLGQEPSIAESWATLVRSLANDPVFRESYITPEFLKSGKAFWRGTYFGLTRSEDPSNDGLNAMLCVRTTLCLILGHVLGWMHFRDLKARKMDAERPIPRSLALPVSASNEMIAGQLLMVEQAAFSERREKHYLPETVVRQIGNAVEGMSKQLWPEEFEKVARKNAKLREQGHRPRTGQVLEVLRRKKTSGNALEMRFASGAEPLYTLYRNVSEHEPITFQCSWHEGHYFFVGVRLLMDLKRRILAERKSADI